MGACPLPWSFGSFLGSFLHTAVPFLLYGSPLPSIWQPNDMGKRSTDYWNVIVGKIKYKVSLTAFLKSRRILGLPSDRSGLMGFMKTHNQANLL